MRIFSLDAKRPLEEKIWERFKVDSFLIEFKVARRRGEGVTCNRALARKER